MHQHLKVRGTLDSGPFLQSQMLGLDEGDSPFFRRVRENVEIYDLLLFEIFTLG